MIIQSTFFSIIIIACAALGIIGGILGVFAFRYMSKNREFINFLICHFERAIKEANNRKRKK
jgi:hypothetical protein